MNSTNDGESVDGPVCACGCGCVPVPEPGPGWEPDSPGARAR
jgi:hypothetical protein